MLAILPVCGMADDDDADGDAHPVNVVTTGSAASGATLARGALPAILSILLDDDNGAGAGSGGGLPGSGPGSNYVLLASNDLGMHCADQDFRIFSILPPFNVVHAQVVNKGATPQVMDDTHVSLVYQASSSPVDPAGANSINKTNQISAIFKTNFWAEGNRAIPLSTNTTGAKNTWGVLNYERLYPSVLAGSLLQPPVDLASECATTSPSPAGCPSILNLFDPIPVDTGIPVPNVEKLDNGVLEVAQQTMPGLNNAPQPFQRFDRNVRFFTAFPFGAVINNTKWWSADGIPMSPVDDTGRSNAYPLMKVSAKSGNQTLASLDVVLPVSAEADCQNCHAQALDCGDPSLPVANQSASCNEAGLQNLPANRVESMDAAPGDTPLQKLINAAKINILRLHDQKHGAVYTAADGTPRACDPANDPNQHCLDSRRSIQCSQCHYSPALDLTQQGPIDEPQQGPNGRQQTRHISMSSAMHGFHGSLPKFNGKDLFPAMPGPVGRDPAVKNQVLQETCYQCHPGRNTACLRGAMGSGGVVCQDCHGDMKQVGNDFSIPKPGGNFVLNGSLRVPWASEPGCQSCHTGDALNPNHPAGVPVAPDGLRLLQAWKPQIVNAPGRGNVTTAKVTQSPNSRFAESQATNANGQVGLLYRLSKGHGGVMCEACHGSTHAIWPTGNPNSNDNVAAKQLQGHSGTLTECATCHAAADLGNTLDGPHGMHPVGGTGFANGGHEHIAENNPNACRACHGVNGQGSVLSRVARTRSFVLKECKGGTLCPGGGKKKNFNVTLNKGLQVTCTLCHSNKL